MISARSRFQPLEKHWFESLRCSLLSLVADMRRRGFIAGLGGVAEGWPVAAPAQPSGTQRRIAIFHPAIPVTLLTETGGGSAWRAFFSELRRLGYVEGGNLIIERYSAEGHHERY